MSELLQLAEAVLADERRRLERKLQAGIRRVFVRQGRAFPASDAAAAGALLASTVIAEAAPPPGTDPPPPGTDPWWDIVAGVWPDASDRLTAAIDAIVAQAAQTAASSTLARLGLADDWTMNADVARRLAIRGLASVTSIEDTSKRRIADVIARGVRDRRTVRDIARDIRAEFRGFSASRAETIARTEVADAWGGTAYDVLSSRGFAARIWITAHDERVDGGDPSGPCVDNEAAGPVPVGEAFPSGHMWEPAHPRCRCTTTAYVEE